jgi:hypothetical protein
MFLICILICKVSDRKINIIFSVFPIVANIYNFGTVYTILNFIVNLEDHDSKYYNHIHRKSFTKNM